MSAWIQHPLQYWNSGGPLLIREVEDRHRDGIDRSQQPEADPIGALLAHQGPVARVDDPVPHFVARPAAVDTGHLGHDPVLRGLSDMLGDLQVARVALPGSTGRSR